MAEVYKLAVEGRQDSQQISNVLYYSTLPVGAVTFDPSTMADLAAQWWTDQSVVYLDFLPPAYTAEQITVSIVDEGNRVVSPFDVRVPISGSGTGTNESFSAGSTFIIGFYGLPIGGDFLNKVPKRTYIAYGPATDNLVDRTGLVLLTGVQRTAIESVFENLVTVGLDVYYPLRLGARKDLGGTSAMIVQNAVFRDYASFRKSRMIRPSGN